MDDFWGSYAWDIFAEQIRKVFPPAEFPNEDVPAITHNTDVSNSWEREGEDQEYFFRFSVEGYKVAINVLLYAMTH